MSSTTNGITDEPEPPTAGATILEIVILDSGAAVVVNRRGAPERPTGARSSRIRRDVEHHLVGFHPEATPS